MTDISVIGFHEASDEGFEQLFPFIDDDDAKLLGPIQFTPLNIVREALKAASLSSSVCCSFFLNSYR